MATATVTNFGIFLRLRIRPDSSHDCFHSAPSMSLSSSAYSSWRPVRDEPYIRMNSRIAAVARFAALSKVDPRVTATEPSSRATQSNSNGIGLGVVVTITRGLVPPGILVRSAGPRPSAHDADG